MVNTKVIACAMSILIAIVIVASVLMPALNVASTSTVIENNDGASAIKLSKKTADLTIDMTVENDGTNLTITIGTDTITTALDQYFILSTDSAAIYVNDKDAVIATWTTSGTTQQIVLSGDFTVATTASYLVINDGSDHNLPLPSSYMFVPSSNGTHGSFINGNLNKNADDSAIASGYYADVAAYNANTILGDALTETVVSSDDKITSVSWVKGSAAAPVTPGEQITGAAANYTDGDWSYDLASVGGVQKAVLIRYSGSYSGGVFTIPSTIGGYDVYQIGDGLYAVPSGAIPAGTKLVISPGPVVIADRAFYIMESFGGTNLVIPSTITTIGSRAFESCRFISSMILPESVASIGERAFRVCKFTDLVVPSSVVSIGDGAFTNSNIKQVLNLSDLEITTTSYGLAADSVKDHIDGSLYVAPLSVTAVKETSYASLLSAIPIIVLAAILLATAGMMLLRRE